MSGLLRSEPPRLDPEEHSARSGENPSRLTATLAGLAAVAFVTAAAIPADRAADGPVVCPFRLVTGLPCPGCGMTRAFIFLMHGDAGAGLSANPFVVVVVPAAAALLLTVAVAAARRHPLPDVTAIARRRLTVATVILWLAFGVVRAVAVLTGHASA